jgi:hypothetical protein
MPGAGGVVNIDPVQLREQLQVWRDELIDLSRRNKLLNLRPGKGVIEVIQPAAEAVLDGLGSGWRFHYPPLQPEEAQDEALTAALEVEDPDLSDVVEADELLTTLDSARELSNRLRSLERRASSEWIDKGVRILYLGVGLLEWSDSDGQQLFAPLLLVPVRLYRNSPREPYRLTSTDDDWVVNPALAVKLNMEFGIELPELDDEMSVPKLLAEVQQAVSSQHTWKVSARAVLSTFSFQKNAMYKDLKENEARILEHPLIQAIGPGDQLVDDLVFDPIDERDLDEVAPPEELASILDADATQRACITAARDGRSFVMDGPPGTGKSQTIANIIAELIHAGQTVLFVSEKAAALDVVHERLESAQLDHFVLALHSAKATRKEVAKALGEALESRPRASEELTPAELVEVRDAREQLSNYAAAINEVRQPLNLSLADAIGRHAQLETAPRAPIGDQVVAALTESSFAQILLVAKQLALNWDSVERGDDFLWWDLQAPDALRGRIGALESDLDQLIELRATLTEVCAQLWSELGQPPLTDHEGMRWLAELLELLDSPPPLALTWVTTPDFDGLAPLVSERHAAARRLAEERAGLERISAKWHTLPDGLSDRLTVAANALAAIEPTVDLESRTQLESLARRAEEFQRLADAADAVLTSASETAALFGIVAGGSLSDVQALAELAMLADSPNRPEPDWLDQASLARARDAARILRPLIDNYRSMTANLAKIFTDSLFSLDVEALYGGEDGVEPQLSRMSGEGRANRRRLKACIQGGKITDEALAALPSARRLQRLGATLTQTEAERAAELGDFYYRHTETDFAALNEALDTAERALVLSAGADPVQLAARVGRTALDPGGLRLRGTTLAGLVAQLRSKATALNPAAAELLERSDIGTVRDWAAAAAVAMGRLDGELAALSELIGPSASVDDATNFARQRDAYSTLESSFLGTLDADQRRLGDGYVGEGTDWKELGAGLDWVRALRALFGGALSEADALALDRIQPELWPIPEQLQRLDKGLDTLSGHFAPSAAAALRQELSGEARDAQELLAALRASTSDIDTWSNYVTATEALRSHGLHATVEFCVEERLPSALVPATIERAVLSSWIDENLANDTRCRPLRAPERDQLVEDFRALDARLGRHAAARVINACSERRPNTAAGESAIIRAEAQKKARHRPIRTLLNDAGTVVRALTPCFMMSPLSVSQYLGPDFTFDVVIFDEASQVRPSDAINCIYRGKRLIVAGDEKQLPPTSFFDVSTAADTDEYDEEALEEFESVLALCRRSASLRPLPLRWHYRSRHESLITFSNHHFYDGQLISYPGAHERSPELGVEFFHVPDGVYTRGTARDNPIEARRVVERVLFHAEHHPQRTLGVVAFSEAQATRIEREVEFARRDRPELDAFFAEDRLDGFFIKNLENVQGDERDIIIFSVGYGPDEAGKFLLNMGALNRTGGERRLNVAVTRARRRVEVVSSITAAQLPETSGSAGVRALRAYLRYAAEGAEALLPEPGDVDGEVESPFEAEVRKTIEGWGYVVRSQVGHAGYRIDLGVLHPERDGEYALAVECDGAAYHSSKVARDRDRLRQEVLEGLGWQMFRVWGPAWYRDRAKEELRLKNAIERVVAGESLRAADYRPTAVEPEVEVHEVDLDEQPEWVHDYEPYDRFLTFRHELTDVRARGEAQQLIVDILGQEGPMTTELCVRRVCEMWGVQRRARAVDAVHNVIKALVASGQGVTELEPGVLHVGAPPSRVRGATGGRAPRSVSEVPQVELRLAIAHLAEDAKAIDAAELQTRVARVFGWKRNGAEITAALKQAIVEATRLNQITVDGAGMVRPPR